MNELYESSLMSFNMVRGKSSDDILKAYVATFFASLIDLRMNGRGTELTNDRNCMNLNRVSNTISPLNFWGHVVFKSESADVKKKVGNAVSKELAAAAGRVVSSRVKLIHRQVSVGDVDWEEMYDSAKILMVRCGQKTYNNDVIVAGIYYWNEMSENAKSQVISKAYNLLMQCNPESPYMNKLRAISTNNLTNAGGDDDTILKGVSRLFKRRVSEEAAVGADGASVESVGNPNATQSGDVSTNPLRLFKNKVVKRRVKKFDYSIFKAPKRFRIKKTEKEKDVGGKTDK